MRMQDRIMWLFLGNQNVTYSKYKGNNMILEEILLTGVESGGTAGTKINLAIVEVNKLIAPRRL